MQKYEVIRFKTNVRNREEELDTTQKFNYQFFIKTILKKFVVAKS